MKPIKTFIFILSIMLLLGVAWYFFPADGISVGPFKFRFPSLAEHQEPEEQEDDVEEVRRKLDQSFVMSCTETMYDSLNFFRGYLKENPNRIYLPNDDYTFFDSVFAQFSRAKEEGQICRVMHYGDSQIEMDRISSVVRQKLQELFGGSGPNMIPAIQPVQTISVSQGSKGLSRYMIYGDAHRASHNRYGVMAQFSKVAGDGLVSFTKTSHSQAFEKAKEISTVSVLLGKNSQGFTATLQCDTLKTEPKILDANDDVSLITWHLPVNVPHGTIRFKGNAEIYAVLLDGEPGVALDNNALRGCSGTIFSRINEETMYKSFQLLNTKLIIMQFGGNRMPGITSPKNISSYLAELEKEIAYMHRVAPQATLMFIGPSDMGRKHDGKMGTWKGLPELNDSLRVMALRNNVAYWDMFHVMGGEGSMVQWVKHSPPWAGADYIHFTFKGAQVIGTALAKSFTTYYDFYKLRQHVPNQDVLDFINHNESEELKHTPYWKMMPSYQPYSAYLK